METKYAKAMASHRSGHDYKFLWYLLHNSMVSHMYLEKMRIPLHRATNPCGRSLNDVYYQDPDTTENTVGILPRFMGEPIACLADLEEIFLLMRVSEIDRGVLGFLRWPQRDLPLEPPNYQMEVHPYGQLRPFCLQTILVPGYDQAVPEATRTSFYVADCLASFAADVQEVKFAKEFGALLAREGF